MHNYHAGTLFDVLDHPGLHRCVPAVILLLVTLPALFRTDKTGIFLRFRLQVDIQTDTRFGKLFVVGCDNRVSEVTKCG